MSHKNAHAAADDLPKDPLAPPGRLSLEIDMAALRSLTMRELCDFRDAIHAIGIVVGGIACQPRFGFNGANAAGRLLEDITDLINGFEQAAFNVAQAANPETARDAEWRSWTILGFDADMTDDLAGFAVRAAEAVRDNAELQFRERHPRLKSELSA